MSEEYFIEYSAPTLAGIKTANLFTCNYTDKREVLEDIRKFNNILIKKGIRAIPVKYYRDRVLIYVYRPSFLTRDLGNEKSSCLLKEMGYDVENMDKCVSRLCNKISRMISTSEFPHEIGLFLGYPFEDVKGFIDHKGECSKCTGYWKVYGDKDKARETFCRYEQCTKEYKKRAVNGMSLDSLAVSA